MRQLASFSPASVGSSIADLLKPGAFYPQESCVNNLLSLRSRKIHLNFTGQEFVFYVQTGLILVLSTLFNTLLIYILMSVNKKSKYDSWPDMHWIFINLILASQAYQKDICISRIWYLRTLHNTHTLTNPFHFYIHITNEKLQQRKIK